MGNLIHNKLQKYIIYIIFIYNTLNKLEDKKSEEEKSEEEKSEEDEDNNDDEFEAPILKGIKIKENRYIIEVDSKYGCP